MAIGLGATNPIPFYMGGGDSFVEDEQQVILSTMQPALDPDSSTGNYAEAYGEAIAIAMIWAVNKRLANQAVPERMMENLTVWEEACGMRPTVDEFDITRRARLSAKFRATSNNALGDISAAASKLLGSNFVALHKTDPTDWITYWPGINPGPPGLEWSSNRAKVSVQMDESNLDNKELASKQQSLVNQLDGMIPSWMSFQVGVGVSFLAGVGIVGKTIV